VKVKFWGVRGSIPTPWADAMGVGGNTSCVEVVSAQGDFIILDAGTGIRMLSKARLAEQTHEGQRIHVLLSHTHWDHIQGIPFFSLLNYPGNHVTFYGRDKADCTFEEVIRKQMDAAYFPVSLDQVQARIDFVSIREESFQIGSVAVQSVAFNHPGGVLGFRLVEDQKVLVYATDMEYTPSTLPQHLIAFAQNADILIFDAQYTPEEHDIKSGWGHSNYEVASRLAKLAQVHKLYLFSHDPDHSDEILEEIEQKSRGVFAETHLAKERDSFSL
jgi:phosphoribosyl 1,2-cyclic phosphodiesterase